MKFVAPTAWEPEEIGEPFFFFFTSAFLRAHRVVARPFSHGEAKQTDCMHSRAAEPQRQILTLIHFRLLGYHRSFAPWPAHSSQLGSPSSPPLHVRPQSPTPSSFSSSRTFAIVSAMPRSYKITQFLRHSSLFMHVFLL